MTAVQMEARIGSDMPQTVEGVKRQALPILTAHGVRRAAVFGSVARAEAGIDSDVDLLVEIGESASLLDVIALKLDLEDALGCKVDVVEYNAVRPTLRNRVLAEQVPIL